jgi:molybdopterin/thiamine biosynthesis adenylyltransferase
MSRKNMEFTDIAKRRSRSGREFLVAPKAELKSWAGLRNLSLRQAFDAALAQGIFPESYERNFPSLSPAQQLTLFRGSILVAGLGGLGGCQATLLARIGVGRLVVADGDVFTASNLNRQLLASGRTLGQNKARVALEHIHDLNPAVIVEAVPDFLTPGNLGDHLVKAQVALDALDSIPARRGLFSAARRTGVPLVHGAVLGNFGQVTTIMPNDPDIFAKLYPHDSISLEAGREVLAPAVWLVASLQVQEAIRLLLGQPPAYHGRLAHFDGDTGRLEIMALG